MADVQPFKALHYDLGVVGSLDAVAAPPYDVIDAAGRAALLARSPYNAVAIDLPKPFDPADPASDPEGDPYEGAARTIDAWRADGALVADEEPSIWAMTQDYTAPDGSSHSRHGILARVRVEDYERGRPPARAHPPRPAAGPAGADPGHRLQPLADLLAQHRGRLAAGRAGAGGRALGRGDGRGRHRQPRLAGHRPRRPRRRHRAPRRRRAADRRRPPPLRDRPRLPRRGRRRGPAQLHADGADRARRPRPHRLPHPPPALRLRRRPRAPAPPRQRPARAVRDRGGRAASRSTPPARTGVGVFGLYDDFHKQAYRLRLKDTADLDRRLDGKPESYRRLDSAILETLVLKGLAGMSDEDIDERARARVRQERPRRARPWSTAAASTSPSSSARSRSSRSGPSPRPTPTCRRSRPTSSPR